MSVLKLYIYFLIKQNVKNENSITIIIKILDYLIFSDMIKIYSRCYHLFHVQTLIIFYL